MDRYSISRRDLISLSLSLPMAFLLSCKKDDSNLSLDDEEDDRNQMELIPEPDGITYYKGRKPDYIKVNVFNKDLLYPGYSSFRIPVIATTNKGTLLAFSEMRSGGDFDAKTIVFRRSTDNGQSWSPLILAEERSSGKLYGNENVVIDRNTGDIHLLYLQIFSSGGKNTGYLYHKVSTDDGLTWSGRKLIPDMIDPAWMPLGPGVGIQLERGIHAGRLLVAGRYTKGDCGIFSDDGGSSWNLGYMSANGNGENESTCVELAKTSGDESVIYINSRNQRTLTNTYYRRLEAYSYDSGESLNDRFRPNNCIKTVKNEGALLRLSAKDKGAEKNRILFSTSNFFNIDNAKGANEQRRHIGIWSTFDETETWTPVPKRVQDMKGGYSCMNRISGGLIGILFEEGASNSNYYDETSFVKINEAFLDVPLIGAKWDFEDLKAGDTVPDGREIKETFSGGTSRNIVASGSFKVTKGSKIFKQSTALAFNGTSYLKLNDEDTWTQFDFNENSSFSVEIVLKAKKAAGPFFLIGRPYQTNWPQWLLFLENDGKVSFRIDDDVDAAVVKTKAGISDGKWHHIGAVRDRNLNKLKIYVDGNISGEVKDNIEGSLANRRPLFIGGTGDGSIAGFKGAISYVRITPKVLSKFFK